MKEETKIKLEMIAVILFTIFIMIIVWQVIEWVK